MGIEHVFLRRAFVEILVTLRRIVKRDHFHVDGFGNLHLVLQNRLHQLAVVPHHRALAGGESVRLRPTQSDSNAKVASFRAWIDAPGSSVTYRPGMPMRTAGPCHFHQGVQHRGGLLHTALVSMAARLKADAINSRSPPPARPESARFFRRMASLRQIDGFATEALRLLQPLRNHVADDHNSRAQQLQAAAQRDLPDPPRYIDGDSGATPAVTAP